MNRFSVFIPTYNAELWLGGCLESIYGQDYPADKIEVLVVDGGSTDRTEAIARNTPSTFLNNPQRQAHFAFGIYGQQATGDLVVMFAADNELVGPDWFSTVNACFEQHPELGAVWGRQISGKQDRPINQYFALIQSEPLSFFTNKNLDRYLAEGQTIRSGNKDGKLFRVLPERPLVWGANGLVLKFAYVQKFFNTGGFIGDNDIFQNMIEENHNQVAFFPSLNIVHHHVRSLGEWTGKLKRNYAGHFLAHKDARNMRWAFGSEFFSRFFLWCIYAGIPVFSGVHALWLALRDRTVYWLYHPLLNFVQFFTYARLTLFTAPGRNHIKKTLWKALKSPGPIL